MSGLGAWTGSLREEVSVYPSEPAPVCSAMDDEDMTASMWVVFGATEVAFLLASWRARQLWSNSTRVFDDVDNVRMRSYPSSSYRASSPLH